MEFKTSGWLTIDLVKEPILHPSVFGARTGGIDGTPAIRPGLREEERDSRPMPNNHASRRVLVVDDEALLRWSLAQILEDEGFEVEQARSGTEALHSVAASDGTFDVVLLDFRLPDSNDLNLLSKLRQMTPRSAIILMSAFSTPEVVQGALDLGAVQFVNKPFDMNEMVRLVEQVS